ncbi:hypothetical protein J6590_098203 [Homalodisca vitripennis]|nr:hypothetical protein J6590_098203 [Homalodisca vitripennis]
MLTVRSTEGVWVLDVFFKGRTRARFQMSGKTEDFNEKLKITTIICRVIGKVSFVKRSGILSSPTALLVILENASSTLASLKGANENRKPATSQGAALSSAI